MPGVDVPCGEVTGGHTPPCGGNNTRRDTTSEFFCDWRTLSYMCIIPAGLAFFGNLLAPESPSWLLHHKSYAKAETALKRLRMQAAPLSEVKVLRRMEHVQRPPMAELLQKLVSLNLRPLLICMCLHVFYQWTGLYGVVFFENDILEDAGIHADKVSGWTESITAMQIVTTSLTCLVVDKHFGRRPLLILSCLITGVGAFIMAGCFHHCDANEAGQCNKKSKTLQHTFLLGIFVYQIGFSTGMGSIPWLLAAEFFPYELRNLSASICCTINWGCSYAIVKILAPCGPTTGPQACVPVLIKGLKIDGVFFLFGSVCIFAIAFSFLLVPETKGKPLDDITKTFDDAASDDRTTIRNERPVGLRLCGVCNCGRRRDGLLDGDDDF